MHEYYYLHQCILIKTSEVFPVTESFIRERITELRIKKGVSEYKMSTDMGHSKSYIQSITSGRALPSLGEFIYMCEYLEISPKDFFDQNIIEPPLVRQLSTLTQSMSDKDLLLLINLANHLYEKNQTIQELSQERK